MTRWLSSVVGLALVAHAPGVAAGHPELLAAERPASVRLVEVTSESTAASQSVLITATEPVSYTTLQPDPLTVLITLRNVAAGDVASRVRPAPDDPVDTVEVLDAVDDDGTPMVEVHIRLHEPTIYEVHSRRQTIQVRFARPVALTQAGAPEDVTPAPPLVGRSPSATAIISVGTAVEPHAISVTLHGNGALSPGRIYEAEHLPPRLVIEFPHLAAEAASLTPVEIDPVKQVRVVSKGSDLTYVELDLVRPAVFHIETLGRNDQILRVVFPRDRTIDPVARIGGDPPVEAATAWEVEAAIAELPSARQLTGAVVALSPDAGPLLVPVPGDVPPRLWPEIRQLTGGVVALSPAAGPLLVPVPGDVPPRVWPQIRQLTGAVVALSPAAGPLLVPVPGDVPPRLWPQIRQLPGGVVGLSPAAGPLLVPVPGDVPPRLWPQIRQLPGGVVGLSPAAGPLLVPVPGDVPPRVWPQIRQLTGAVVALSPAAGPLLVPVPGDVPPRVWPQIRQLTGGVVALSPAAGPLLLPVPGDVPPRVWPPDSTADGRRGGAVPGRGAVAGACAGRRAAPGLAWDSTADGRRGGAVLGRGAVAGACAGRRAAPGLAWDSTADGRRGGAVPGCRVAAVSRAERSGVASRGAARDSGVGRDHAAAAPRTPSPAAAG